MKKYYLGLDIGLSSVGWAISSDEGIEDFGVQIWEMPKITNNKLSITNSAKRRKHRHILRLSNRKRAQKVALRKILLQEGIISSFEINNLSLGDWVKDLNDKENIYDVRCNALDKKQISNKHLTWILLKYINKRGEQEYQNIQKLIPEKGIESISNKVKKEKKLQKQNDNINYGLKINKDNEFPAYNIKNTKLNKYWKGKIKNKKYFVRNLIYPRTSLKSECRCILENYGIEQNVIDKILKTIFNQFTREDGPDPMHGENHSERMKNRTELAKELKKQQDELLKQPKTPEVLKKIKYLRNQRTALNRYLPLREYKRKFRYIIKSSVPKATILGDCFKFCQKAINDGVITKDSDKSEFLNLIKSFFTKPEEKIPQSQFEKVCKFWSYLKGTSKKTSKLSFFKNTPKINDIHNLTEEGMLQRLKEFAKFDKEVSYVFSDFITEEKQYERLQRYIVKGKIKSLEQYRKKLYKKFSTFNLSKKIMLEAIESFIKEKKLIDDFLDEKEANISLVTFKKLPKKLDETFEITNVLKATNHNVCVFRTLTNVRKLLIDIHKHYREKFNIPKDQRLFESINIKSRKFFKSTKEKRDDIIKEQKKLEKEISENTKILEKFGIIPNTHNQMLLKLYFEQGGKYNLHKGKEEQKATCFLTNESISIQHIKDHQAANGHIIPRGLGINRIENRFIILKETNQSQGNMLPYEYIINKKNEFEKEYLAKVKKNSKGIKSKLLRLKNKNSDEFKNLFNELLDDSTKDVKYVLRVFTYWLSIELIKRDYVINNYTLVDKMGNIYEKNEYEKWWKEKRDEMYNQRINQIPSYMTSTFKKNIFSQSEFSSWKFSDESGVWAFKKEKIERLTEWANVIDGIVLSLSYPALFFYEFNSSVIKLYLSRINEIRRISHITIRFKECNELKSEIKKLFKEFWFTLKEKLLSREDYPDWYRNIERNVSIIIKDIYNYGLNNNSKPFKKPKVKLYKNMTTKIENYVSDTIPIKLKWFRINEIAYNLIYHFAKGSDEDIKSYILNWKEIINILKQQLLHNSVSQKNEFITKAIEERKSIEGKVYILFKPIFKYFKNNLSKKTRNSIVRKTIEFFEVLISCLSFDKKNITKNIFSVADFILTFNDSNDSINIVNKKIIKDFLYWKRIDNIHFSFIKDIYVNKIDDNPKKVIKYLSDGKLKNKKPLTSSTNPLGLESNNRIQKKLYKKVQNKEQIEKRKLDKHYLAGIIISENENDYRNKFDSIVNNIRKLRKNYILENHNQINEQLHKYDCIIDKNGSLWSINIYVGLLYSWKKENFIKPITFYDLNKCVGTITNVEKKIELIPFGTTVFLKGENFNNYPFVMVDLQNKKRLKVFLKMNGISNIVLKEKRWLKLISDTQTSKRQPVAVKASKINVLKNRCISFHGTLITQNWL